MSIAEQVGQQVQETSGGKRKYMGIKRVVRTGGAVQELEHTAHVVMQQGDVFEIHTPGGGLFRVSSS